MTDTDEAGTRRFTLTVVEFTGTEEISRPYSFSILVSSDRDDLEIMDRGATFTIRGLAAGSTRASYHGAITRCEDHHALANLFSYRVTLEPRLTRLARTRHSDAYLDEETMPGPPTPLPVAMWTSAPSGRATGGGPACTSMMNPAWP